MATKLSRLLGLEMEISMEEMNVNKISPNKLFKMKASEVGGK